MLRSGLGGWLVLGDSWGGCSMNWKEAKNTQWKTKSLARSMQYVKNVGYATFGDCEVILAWVGL